VPSHFRDLFLGFVIRAKLKTRTNLSKPKSFVEALQRGHLSKMVGYHTII
jgi:hypothetical protein